MVSEHGEPITLAWVEWEHIQRVLKDAHGNVSETARRLGVWRRTLQRKLQRGAPKTERVVWEQP